MLCHWVADQARGPGAVDDGDEIAGWDAEKAILSLPTPIGGTVVEVNEQIAARPDLGCIDPYGAGWITKIAPSAWEAERVFLLTMEDYLALYAKRGTM